MSSNKRIATVAASVLLVAGTTNAQAPKEVTLANAGTLTCTTSETPQKSGVDAELSCIFKSPSGKDGDFTGYIARRGQADVPPGRRVLVWSVLAPSEDIDVAAIAGTYAGQTGGAPPGRLVGGDRKTIVLQPTGDDSQISKTPVPTVLELKLEPLKA
jgi:hypothetical protein